MRRLVVLLLWICGQVITDNEMDVKQRFWSKVRKTETCWLWTAARNEWGYGLFRFEGKLRLAHRVIWTLECGPIPTGICVLHRCDTPACVRRDHLFLGTNKDNAEDMMRKGRGRTRVVPQRRLVTLCGSSNPISKLTDEQAEEIRRTYAVGELSQRRLASIYGVAQAQISRIVRRVSYVDHIKVRVRD
jgi:hypothetical protein